MKDKKFKIPIRYVLFILTFFCLMLMALTYIRPAFGASVRNAVNSVLTPMQIGLNKVGTRISTEILNFTKLRDAQEENEQMKVEIDRLKQENLRLYEGKYELDELRELLALRDEYAQYEMTGANVIQKETGNWFREFTIDKGTDDGIFVDANVLANGALVGRVIYAGKNYAKVLSLIDDTSNVGAMTLENSTYCVVSGSLADYERGLLQLEYTEKDAVINEGDLIVTSHVSNVYLPGLAIGYATEMTVNPDNLTKSGYLTPMADFSNIQKVLVIMTKKASGEEGTPGEQ
ncbi:MAG: rod shape-determining protein MreC [Lachnospiraceae bacterium]|nr:rod shape-determining protein MreC [Lachnospiraceae bacterium]